MSARHVPSSGADCGVFKDGLNMLQLKWAQIEIYLKLHQTQELLETTIYEGYPPNTADRALSLHLSYLLTDPESFVNESRDESDERLFMLRPYVFAAHKVCCRLLELFWLKFCSMMRISLHGPSDISLFLQMQTCPILGSTSIRLERPQTLLLQTMFQRPWGKRYIIVGTNLLFVLLSLHWRHACIFL